MDYNFKNIIDLLLYAIKKNLCDIFYTCDALVFRTMCKDIGKVEIKRLIESVTDEDIEQMPTSVSYWDWCQPMGILLREGFHAEPYCPMMRWFSEGDLAHKTTCRKKLILEMDNRQVYGIIGSIFYNSECEVTAIFNESNGGISSYELYNFLKYYPFLLTESGIREAYRMPPHARPIYYGQAFETLQDVKEVERMIEDMLSFVSSRGYQSVAMNALSTTTYNPSELDNLNIIERWFKQHPESPIHTVHLVDKMGGFNRLDTARR